ncbi:MAG: hypothetical protein LBH59_01645 [Planctomycetaceae bacterium]|jgi:hypothetical protein|nr:hypothetical protein [Planctomycetaceae bacterium]
MTNIIVTKIDWYDEQTDIVIPKPVWAVGFALEQTLRDATLVVFSFLILKRLQHI